MINAVTKDIHGKLPCCIKFTDEVILIDEFKMGLNDKFEEYRLALDSNDFCIRRKKHSMGNVTL